MSPIRVLIVDDDRRFTRLARMILEGAGTYEVKIMSQASFVVTDALKFRPHVMLLNVNIPDKEILDMAAATAVDARLREIPILFLTPASCRGEDWTPPFESGAMKFLAKPIEPSLLLAAVADLVSELAAV